MFLRGWDIGKLMIVHSKSIKEYGCNVDQHIVTPNRRMSQNVTTQSMVPKGPAAGGETLKFAPTPQGVQGVPMGLSPC